MQTVTKPVDVLEPLREMLEKQIVDDRETVSRVIALALLTNPQHLVREAQLRQVFSGYDITSDRYEDVIDGVRHDLQVASLELGYETSAVTLTRHPQGLYIKLERATRQAPPRLARAAKQADRLVRLAHRVASSAQQLRMELPV